jgi:hypothetical protein
MGIEGKEGAAFCSFMHLGGEGEPGDYLRPGRLVPPLNLRVHNMGICVSTEKLQSLSLGIGQERKREVIRQWRDIDEHTLI